MLFLTSFVYIWLQAYLICSHVDKSSTILFSCWVAKRLTVRFPVWENPKVDKIVLMLTEVVFLADYLDVVQPTILLVDPASLR